MNYSAALHAIGLDYEVSWRLLQEGTYPIDATRLNLDRLADDLSDLRTIADLKGHPRGGSATIP